MKVNAIAWLEFELACDDIAVLHFSHDVTETLITVEPFLNFYLSFQQVIPFNWLVVMFYDVLTLFELFSAELGHFHKSFKQFSLVQVQFFAHTQLNVKTVLFQTIQFNINTEFKCQKQLISNNSF